MSQIHDTIKITNFRSYQVHDTDSHKESAVVTSSRQNDMKTMNLLLLITSLITFAARADVDPAARFPGFTPTVIADENTLKTMFSTMEEGFKDFNPILLRFGTQCTARAETWAYDLYKTQNVRSQKVFVFYTRAYHEYYARKHGHAFKWWFHVSPYVLVNTQQGVQERVIDHAFSDKPQTMKEWTDLFIESGEACVENVPFANFEGDVTGDGASYNKNAHCYIVRAPMFDMFPASIDARERGQRSELEFSLGDVRFAAKALTIHARKKYFDRVGL